jgi:hypothetical protein
MTRQFVLDAARERARIEMEEEDYNAEKEREKARIRRRQRTTWWQRMFPFQIKITRREL